MESCPTQAVLPLVGLAAEKVIRDRYICEHLALFHLHCGDNDGKLGRRISVSRQTC
ncbi:MAG: hypothetical protein ACQESR_11580 [Planctomycetota bacterium]